MKNCLLIIFFLLFACQNPNNLKKNKKDNLFGTQFHPEKSDKTGLKIIENFIKL